MRTDQRTLFRFAGLGPPSSATGTNEDDVERVPSVREAREEGDAQGQVEGLVQGVGVGAEGALDGCGAAWLGVECDGVVGVVDQVHGWLNWTNGPNEWMDNRSIDTRAIRDESNPSQPASHLHPHSLHVPAVP